MTTSDIRPWNSIATTYFKAYMRVRHAWDSFAHDETAQWGDLETSNDTQSWTNTGGSASDYSIAGGVAQHLLGSIATRLSATADFSLAETQVTTTLRVDQVAADAAIAGGVVGRFVDVDNYYIGEALFNTDQTITIRIRQRVSGSMSTLQTFTTDLTHDTATWYGLTLQIQGTTLRLRMWDTSVTTEPDTWDVEHFQAFDLITGGAGLRSFINAGNSNTNPTTEYRYFSASTPLDWVDITSYVSIAQTLGAEVEGWIGRQTELSDIEPSRLNFAVKNQTGWFTPDNILSPYWPDWGTGTPLRWFETIGARTFQPVPDMWLEVPEVSASTWLTTDEESSDRMLYLNAVDLLTRLNNAPTFVSNLAEYIVYEATEGALRAYWPLVDASGSTYAASAGPVVQDPLRFERQNEAVAVKFVDSLMNFGTAEGPPGDDGTALEFTPVGLGTIPGRMASNSVTNTTPGDTGVATLLGWVYVPSESTSFGQLLMAYEYTTGTPDIWMYTAGSLGNWTAVADTASGTGTVITGPAIVAGQWHLVGVQMDYSTGDFELWVDGGDPVTGNTGGGGTNGASLSRVFVDGGQSLSGMRMAHAQLYIGDADAFTHADFLAQLEIGLNGFGQQTVDQRIRLICNYAGVADSQLDLEESASPIQAPAFAGRRPGALASAAAVTGGGILFTRSSELVYQDRKHRFTS